MPDDSTSAAPYMSEAIDEFIKGAEELRKRGVEGLAGVGHRPGAYVTTRFSRIIDEAIAEMETARTKLHYAFELLPKEAKLPPEADDPTAYIDDEPSGGPS